MVNLAKFQLANRSHHSHIVILCLSSGIFIRFSFCVHPTKLGVADSEADIYLISPTDFDSLNQL